MPQYSYEALPIRSRNLRNLQKQYYNKIFFQLIACQFTSSTNAWILAFELDIARKKSMFEHMHRHSWLLGLPSIWLHWYFVCRVFRFLSLRIRNLTLDWDSFLVDLTSKDYVLHTWELKMASSFLDAHVIENIY